MQALRYRLRIQYTLISRHAQQGQTSREPSESRLYTERGDAGRLFLGNFSWFPVRSKILNGAFVLTLGVNETPRHKAPYSRVIHWKWGCEEVINALGINPMPLPASAQSLPPQDPAVVPT